MSTASFFESQLWLAPYTAQDRKRKGITINHHCLVVANQVNTATYLKKKQRRSDGNEATIKTKSVIDTSTLIVHTHTDICMQHCIRGIISVFFFLHFCISHTSIKP